MPATFSIRGLYNADNTLFSEMSICSDMTRDDKDTIVQNILIEYAELEALYPDPAFMKHAIGAWSWKEVPTWDRIYAAAMAEYNPIENYNRTETASEQSSGTHSEQGSGSETHSGMDSETRLMTNNETHGGKDTETNSGTDTVAHSGIDSSTTSNTHTHTGTVTDANSGTDTVTTNRAAFDTNTLVTTGTDTTQHGHSMTRTFNETESDSGSASVTHGESVGTTHGHKLETQHGETIGTDFEQTTDMTHGHRINQTDNKSGTNSGTVTRSSHIAGNIGVTTSQQMLEQELVVSAKLNVYNYIMESFKNRFCLEVW